MNDKLAGTAQHAPEPDVSSTGAKPVKMTTRTYQVRFLTPAFLGNAEQDGQWRTPPFKALLRQWWRVAWAQYSDYGNDVARLRSEEGLLFGAAADGAGNRSLVRLRLQRWSRGTMTQWPEDLSVNHPDVNHAVGAHLYLGFGPLNYNNKGTFLGKKEGRSTFKPHAAIQAGEETQLSFAFPVEHAQLLDRAISLIASYGTLGGRSRNGWGSLELESGEKKLPLDQLPLRDWRDCLDRDWPHAIGSDTKGPLVWRTEPFDDWKSLMQRLAEVKIGLRTQFQFQSGKNADRPESRHWISYPVTHHNVKPWRQGRLPNSLRFKVRADENGKLCGVIFHVPCLPPAQFRPDRGAIEAVWRQVHAFLDAEASLTRIPQ